MKTSAAARSSDDAPLSFNNRIPERKGFGGFLISGGRRVQVLRSSSHLKPIAFIFSACSGVTSLAEAAYRGVGVARRGTTSAVAVQSTYAAMRRMLTSSAILRALEQLDAVVHSERLQPRCWLEIFENHVLHVCEPWLTLSRDNKAGR